MTTETVKEWNSSCGDAHGKDWMDLIGHLANRPGACGLEVGTFKGDSAEWMLANIFTGLGSRYVCVDTFEGSVEHHLAGVDCSRLEAMTRDRLKKYSPFVQIHKSESAAFLRNPWKQFDFIYIDAAHDAMNVLRDGVLAFDLLKLGGIMLFDDYGWEVMPEPTDRPKLAIDSFLSCYAKRLEVISMGWQVAVKRMK